MKNLFLIAIIVLGFSATSFAQSNATASTTAVLVTPVSIANETPMNFGVVAGSNALGTITLGYSNNTDKTGGASVINSATATTAVFNVLGSANESISVAVSTSDIILSLLGVPTLVKVTDVTPDCGPSTTLVNGAKVIKVGATLNLPANVVAGTYSNASDLFVTVNYN